MRTFIIITSTIALLAIGCSDDTDTNTGKKDGAVTADKGSTADQGTTADQAAQKDAGAADGAAASGFGKVVWPILSAGCSCHKGGSPGSLSLPDEATSYTNLVGKASTGCATLKLVEAGDAAKSYLVQKLEGSGSCFTGDKMPKGGSLTAAQITAIKGWITAGAKK